MSNVLCIRAMDKLDDSFFIPLSHPRFARARSRNPLLDIPLLEYIFGYVLPTIECPRLLM